jgi:hypothetical protein
MPFCPGGSACSTSSLKVVLIFLYSSDLRWFSASSGSSEYVILRSNRQNSSPGQWRWHYWLPFIYSKGNENHSCSSRVTEILQMALSLTFNGCVAVGLRPTALCLAENPLKLWPCAMCLSCMGLAQSRSRWVTIWCPIINGWIILFGQSLLWRAVKTQILILAFKERNIVWSLTIGHWEQEIIRKLKSTMGWLLVFYGFAKCTLQASLISQLAIKCMHALGFFFDKCQSCVV